MASEFLTDSKAIISKDPFFKSIMDKAKRVARSKAPVLIEGPSGTGKELLARQVHEEAPYRMASWWRPHSETQIFSAPTSSTPSLEP